MPKLLWVLVAVLLAAGGGMSAQKPVIEPNGVVNAASRAGSVTGEALLVGGAIFTVLGENLSDTTVMVSGTPLPISLGGTTVTVDGVAAPLFYVSPGQINFQIPIAVSGWVGERLPVVVTTAAGESEPVLAFVQRNGVGTFTQGAECGQGLIQNVAADGSVSWNTPSNSASPGSFIRIYGTGIGPLYNPPKDGEPVPEEPLAGVNAMPVYLGIWGFNFSYDDPWWVRLTPGLVGMSQVDLRLGDDALEGCAVPITVTDEFTHGVPVAISIRKGGGPCQDAPPANFAKLSWSKVITTSEQFPEGVAEASFTGSFSSAPENLVIPLPDPADPPFMECRCGGFIGRDRASPRCRSAGQTALDAGALTLEGTPGGPLTLALSRFGDETGYRAPLLYVSPGRIDVVAPYALAGQESARIVVSRYGEKSPAFDVPVIAAAPALFTADSSGAGQGAILEYKYPSFIPNSADNPASPGAVITLFGTGAGILDDTTIPEAGFCMIAIPFRTQPVSLNIGGLPARVLYAGPAPYRLLGTDQYPASQSVVSPGLNGPSYTTIAKFQINAVVPDRLPPGLQPVVLTIGPANNEQQRVTIAIK